MNICHVWHNFFPIQSGGVEQYILSLSDFLTSNSGDRFLIVTDKAVNMPLLRSLRTPNFERINSVEVHRLRPTVTSLFGGAVYHALNKRPDRLQKALTRSLSRQAARIRGMDKVDLFHIHGFWSSLYPEIGQSLSNHFGCPFIVTLHGDSVRSDDPFAMPLRAKATVNLLESARVITTFSKETLEVLSEVGLGKNSCLVPNFIDTQKFKAPSPSVKLGTKITIVSRLSAPKDPLTPIRAFAKVAKELPNVTLQIVGYGPLFEKIQRLVEQLKIRNKVEFVGGVSDVRQYLWNSDVFITTRGSYITTLEAWASGLPVLAPNYGIMKELITDGVDGFLTEPGDADQLSSSIFNIL